MFTTSSTNSVVYTGINIIKDYIRSRKETRDYDTDEELESSIDIPKTPHAIMLESNLKNERKNRKPILKAKSLKNTKIALKELEEELTQNPLKCHTMNEISDYNKFLEKIKLKLKQLFKTNNFFFYDEEFIAEKKYCCRDYQEIKMKKKYIVELIDTFEKQCIIYVKKNNKEFLIGDYLYYYLQNAESSKRLLLEQLSNIQKEYFENVEIFEKNIFDRKQIYINNYKTHKDKLSNKIKLFSSFRCNEKVESFFPFY